MVCSPDGAPSPPLSLSCPVLSLHRLCKTKIICLILVFVSRFFGSIFFGSRIFGSRAFLVPCFWDMNFVVPNFWVLRFRVPNFQVLNFRVPNFWDRILGSQLSGCRMLASCFLFFCILHF